MNMHATNWQVEPLRFREEPHGPEMAKRTLDVVLSATALLLLSPLLILVAIAIRLDSGTGAIYHQTRHGQGRRPFTIYKFRTLNAADGDNVFRQVQNPDDGVTRIGRILRATNIDELPQLWNVLKGDMSLVGPRPHPIRMDERYEPLVRGYSRRFATKPGLTGWAQVNGHRGPTPTLESIQNRIDNDLYYVGHKNLLLDLKIMMLTVFSASAFRNAF